MPVADRNIDEVEQMLAHESHVALQLVRLHRIILVEVERDDIRERQPLFAMHPHQLVVNSDWSVSRGKAEHTISPLGRTRANQIGNLSRDGSARLSRMWVYANWNSFTRGKCAVGLNSAAGTSPFGGCSMLLRLCAHRRRTKNGHQVGGGTAGQGEASLATLNSTINDANIIRKLTGGYRDVVHRTRMTPSCAGNFRVKTLTVYRRNSHASSNMDRCHSWIRSFVRRCANSTRPISRTRPSAGTARRGAKWRFS